MGQSNKKQWYQTPGGIIAFILFLPFFVVWYIWAKSKINVAWKVIITAIVGIIFISALAGSHSPTTSTNTASNTKDTTAQPTTAPVTTPTVDSAPTATSQTATFAQPSKTTGCKENNGLPDLACTPGSTNSAVTQDTIKQTICVSGYTATIRPSTSYTNNLKTQQIQAYGYSDTNLSDYEEDHFIPLEIGGSPDNAANLWPEPYSGTYGAKAKDKVENYLHTQICNGSITLMAAQQEMEANWETVYNAQYGQ